LSLSADLRASSFSVTCVESCTGGLIAAALTDAAGASDILNISFVTYANTAKTKVAGVPEALLVAYGAVSREVVEAMASVGLRAANADMAIAVSGVAGPGGGSAEKPVGLVHIAVAQNDAPAMRTEKCEFDPSWSRAQIREAAVLSALKLANSALHERLKRHSL